MDITTALSVTERINQQRGEPFLIVVNKHLGGERSLPPSPNSYIFGIVPSSDAYFDPPISQPQGDKVTLADLSPSTTLIIPTTEHAVRLSLKTAQKVEGEVRMEDFLSLDEDASIYFFIGDEEIAKNTEPFIYYRLAEVLGLERSTETLRKYDDEHKARIREIGEEEIAPLMREVAPILKRIIKNAARSGIEEISPQTTLEEFLKLAPKEPESDELP